jgi:hypothetical protein
MNPTFMRFARAVLAQSGFNGESGATRLFIPSLENALTMN